jgi:hypothetical protein
MILVLPHILNNPSKGFSGLFFFFFSVFFLSSFCLFQPALWALPSSIFLVFSYFSISSLTQHSRKLACKLVGFSFLLGKECVLQQWLLLVLGRGLGSFFFHVFGYFSFPLTPPSSQTFKGGTCS